MASDKSLLSFVIPEELLKLIDDFRFKNHFSSRAAAIKWLINWALDHEPVPTEKDLE